MTLSYKSMLDICATKIVNTMQQAHLSNSGKILKHNYILIKFQIKQKKLQ